MAKAGNACFIISLPAINFISMGLKNSILGQEVRERIFKIIKSTLCHFHVLKINDKILSVA